MLNVSIGTQIQTGLDGSRTRTTIEKAVRFIYSSSTHACTKSGFILEDSTNSTTRRNRSPIHVLYTPSPSATLLWQSFVKGPTVEKAWTVSRSTTSCRYDKYRLKYKNINWHCQHRATFICRLYGDDTTSDITVLRNRPLQRLVEARMTAID